MKKGRKNCDEQLIEQISNTLEMLLEKGLLYTYNELKREHLDKNTIRYLGTTIYRDLSIPEIIS